MPLPTLAERARRRPAGLAALLLAVLAYVPALLSSPGRMPADTKLYLYLDPGRLIADAPWTFDGRQFGGWVPHQVIAYLWPQGPWFWLGDALALPDWVVHRLWIGTLLFAAGAGVLWLARRLGLGVGAALAAALVYQLSPYVLPYISRTSAMLLPWAGLGWMVGLTIGAATRTRWRDAALCALVVLSVGAVNATALLMVAPAPVLWLLLAALERRITWRRAAGAALRIGGLSLGVSLWWIAMVAIQGREGADVLAYSESLESVSFTATSTEVWRGMGYWLAYVRDPFAATTTAATDHMVSRRVVAASFVLVAIGLVGLAATAWRQRRFAIALVVTGVVLAVGVHPFEDPSPLMDLLQGDGTSGAALALRSSTRAVPMLLLGLALGTGSLVAALRHVRLRRLPRLAPAPLLVVAVAVIAVANLPSLVDRSYVDPALARDQDVPEAWRAASDDLDATAGGGRVLQLPGSEFGAFRWGYTVDPPLPGLTDRPLVTRDLLPLGSPAAMDLLYALDDRFQAGTIEPAAVAPVARWLGADTVWVTGDQAFDRFRTPRPELVHQLVSEGTAAGLGTPVPYGDPVVNVPVISMVDEQSISSSLVGEPVAPVELVPVESPVPVIRAKDDSVVVLGSGDGLVAAAAAGMLDGGELVRYAASLTDAELDEAIDEARAVVVTDSNRKRAHHWRSSQDVHGYTEAPDGPPGGVWTLDVGDERLPVFGDEPDVASMTVAVQDGPVRATASAYGEPFAYRPENRPAMAVDGDPATAWVVGDRADPVGEFLSLEIDRPFDHLTVRQPAGGADRRRLGWVSIAVDGDPVGRALLDDQSLGSAGQRIELGPVVPADGRAVTVTITVDSVVAPAPGATGSPVAAVGFAEVDAGLGPTTEVVVVPHDLERVDGGDRPIMWLFDRERVRPTDRWRSDPEPRLVREFTVPGGTDPAVDLAVTVRLDQRAADEVLADALGITGPTASHRLTGVAAASGWAATDADPATAWTTPFGAPTGARLDLVTDVATDRFTIVQPGGDHAPITSLLLHPAVGDPQPINVPPPDGNGRSEIVLDEVLPAGVPLGVEITGVEQRLTTDRRYGEPVALPAGISEISLGARTTVPDRVDTGCRDDLLTFDGTPVPLRIEASVADLLAGVAVAATPCGGASEVGAGTHRLVSGAGADTGFGIDRVVMSPTDTGVNTAGGREPTATVVAADRLTRTVEVDGCPDGCWLVLGEGFHESWTASSDDAAVAGPATLVDGGFNGWWLEPSDEPVTVELRWTAQRPLTIALVVSVVAVLASIALVLVDRRPATVPPTPPPRLQWLGPPAPWLVVVGAAVVWALAAAALVAPAWGLAGLAGGVLLLLTRRPRLAGYAALAMLGVNALYVLVVVQRDRPPPDAGWPVRFERVHELGLFAAVSLAVAALATAVHPRSQHEEAEDATDRPGDEQRSELGAPVATHGGDGDGRDDEWHDEHDERRRDVP